MIVNGVRKLNFFGAYKALRIRIGNWTTSGLNFEFLLTFVVNVDVDGDLWIAQEWEFWESGGHSYTHILGIKIKIHVLCREITHSSVEYYKFWICCLITLS